MSYYPLESVASRAKVGRKFELFAGHMIRELGGFGLITPPWKIRAETESRKPYENTSDLYVFLNTAVKQRLEIKSKNAHFTKDPASWVYEDVTLFNANKTNWPFAVVFVSIQTKAVLVVPNDGKWVTQRQQEDPARQTTYDVVTAPLESLISLEDFIPILTAACQVPAS